MNEMKRVGRPMNEMKRSKYNLSHEKRLDNVKSRHDNLLKDAINALEMLKLSEQELLMMKKKRISPQNNKRNVRSEIIAKYEKKTAPIIVKKDVSKNLNYKFQKNDKVKYNLKAS